MSNQTQTLELINLKQSQTITQQKSIRTLADINVNIVKEITYTPYGKILNDTNQSLHVHKTFANGLYDKDTNLIRFGKRDYDLRTWTAKDPIDFSGGDSNLYRYVLGDPVNLVDLEGEAWGLAILILAGSTSYLNAPDIDEEPKSGMTPLAEATLSCVGGGGIARSPWSITLDKYINSGGGGLNFRKNGNRFFGIDLHKFMYKGNEKIRLHYHRGKIKSQLKKHRPYQGGW